ncbi:MAG: prephenate dehydratase [Gaiellaceae bacterium]|nr:prephenate dehydratase [Gaiellaceae bacterium]
MHAATETGTTVAYAGGAAAHSAAGAEKLFPGSELVPLGTFGEVVRAVLEARTTLGVLPIESSIAGSVAETHDLLWEHPISIVAETSIPIKHLLVAREPLALADVRVVRSHPMGLEQCRGLLAKLDGVETIAASTTAAAAAQVAESSTPGEAAISSERAAEMYGLHVVAADVGDHPEAFTRFVAVAPYSRVDGTDHQGWRTAFSFVTDHRPAALFHAIEPFAAHGVDLLHLVSRPIPQSPFTYRFDAVLAGHPSDPVTRLALSEVRGRTRVVRIFGSYPAGA